MDGAWWMLWDSTISSDLGKYTVIMDGKNFMTASENFLSVWTTIWPEFTLRKMTLLMIPPTPSIGSFPWRHSLSNQHNDLFKNIVPADSWKINLNRNWAPTRYLNKSTLVNDLPHSISMVSITFFRQLIYAILLWSEFSVSHKDLHRKKDFKNNDFIINKLWIIIIFISFFKVVFYITFYNYKKPINFTQTRSNMFEHSVFAWELEILHHSDFFYFRVGMKKMVGAKKGLQVYLFHCFT